MTGPGRVSSRWEGVLGERGERVTGLGWSATEGGRGGPERGDRFWAESDRCRGRVLGEGQKSGRPLVSPESPVRSGQVGVSLRW